MTDSLGRELYIFELDAGKKDSVCLDAKCLKIWPPFITKDGAKPSVDSKIDSSKIRTFKRSDDGTS